MVYSQYICDFEDELEDLKNKGLYVSLSTCVFCLFYLVVMKMYKMKSVIDFAQWDHDTVTSADFTIDITINKRVYNNWLKHANQSN